MSEPREMKEPCLFRCPEWPECQCPDGTVRTLCPGLAALPARPAHAARPHLGSGPVLIGERLAATRRAPWPVIEMTILVLLTVAWIGVVAGFAMRQAAAEIHAFEVSRRV